MDFAESEAYLLSLGNEVSAMKLGLENIRALLAAVGSPQNSFLKVQVAGTNGKGSVCAFLDSIARSSGIRTGLYTSPHLVSITERIKINGREISEDIFARYATRIRETAEILIARGELQHRPTFFEQVTAISLIAFAEVNVELAILETGLGGRLDATTAAKAEIAAITAIDLDHQEYLGNSLAEIAAEKAAIIHEGSKVVVAVQKEKAMRVILGECHKFGVSPRLASEVIVVSNGKNPTGEEDLTGLAITFETTNNRYDDVRLGLLGKHQIENAKVAILLAETLGEYLKISVDDIVGGLQSARHPGRLEFIDKFLFDGAHNVAGAIALVDYLDEYVDRPITMIFSSMKDKEIEKIARLLFSKPETLILTRTDNSRALTAAELVQWLPDDFDTNRVHLTETVDDALILAQRLANEALILVTGSLYLVGEAQKILKSHSQI